MRGCYPFNQPLSLRGIYNNSLATPLLLGGKTMCNCVADLIVGMLDLKGNLLARKVGVKEESLDMEPLVASKL